MAKSCKDCGGTIEWESTSGRWVPMDPTTQKCHVCQIDQTCEGCQKTFQGANWMKVCQDCYRSGRNAQNPAPAAPSPPRTAEPLQRDLADDPDAPPF